MPGLCKKTWLCLQPSLILGEITTLHRLADASTGQWHEKYDVWYLPCYSSAAHWHLNKFAQCFLGIPTCNEHPIVWLSNVRWRCWEHCFHNWLMRSNTWCNARRLYHEQTLTLPANSDATVHNRSYCFWYEQLREKEKKRWWDGERVHLMRMWLAICFLFLFFVSVSRIKFSCEYSYVLRCVPFIVPVFLKRITPMFSDQSLFSYASSGGNRGMHFVRDNCQRLYPLPSVGECIVWHPKRRMTKTPVPSLVSFFRSWS